MYVNHFFRLYNRNALTNPYGNQDTSNESSQSSGGTTTQQSSSRSSFNLNQSSNNHEKLLKSIIEAPDEFPLLRGGDVVFLSHSEDGTIRYWRDTLLRDRSCVVVLPPASNERASSAEASFADASMTSSSLDMWQVR